MSLSDPTGLATWMCPDGECGRRSPQDHLLLRVVVVLRGWAIGGVSAVLLLAGCSPSPGESAASIEKRAHSQLAVRSHDKVHEYYAKAAGSVYVGARVDDPVPLVSLPGGTFGKPRIDLSTEVNENLSEAATTVDGTRCWTKVYRLRTGREPQGNWSLSEEQRAAVRDGTLEALEVVTTCETGG
ncbi:hypothetical protein AB0G02_23690 [Actinosynnema sp. NPDC023658]|uniref:hypothetical protein n=1 Tax=Actinosynnema sp. NPDC023658 TaxID=3155465 RepID=UPI0033F05A62